MTNHNECFESYAGQRIEFNLPHSALPWATSVISGEPLPVFEAQITHKPNSTKIFCSNFCNRISLCHSVPNRGKVGVLFIIIIGGFFVCWFFWFFFFVLFCFVLQQNFTEGKLLVLNNRNSCVKGRLKEFSQ